MALENCWFPSVSGAKTAVEGAAAAAVRPEIRLFLLTGTDTVTDEPDIRYGKIGCNQTSSGVACLGYHRVGSPNNVPRHKVSN